MESGLSSLGVNCEALFNYLCITSLTITGIWFHLWKSCMQDNPIIYLLDYLKDAVVID